MTRPEHDHPTHDTSTTTVPTLTDRVSAALGELDEQRSALIAWVPRLRDDAGWAQRCTALALNYARRAGWWGVLARASVDDPTIPHVTAQAVWAARAQARTDARFWRESAADWRARALDHPEVTR